MYSLIKTVYDHTLSYVFRYSVCLLCCFSVLCTKGDIFAWDASTEFSSSWQVRSHYIDPFTHRQNPPVIWEFRSERNREGYLVRIQDVIGRLGCRMELMFSDDRRLIRSTTYNLMRGGEKVFHEAFDPSKPAVINNSLIPAEWINVPLEWGKTMTREYKIKRQIGPASFLKTVRLTFEPVLLSGILNENMVTSALMDDLNDRRLLLVRLENVIGDGGEEIIFLQLWAEGIPFWIYEKTSSRQSWLLSAKY